MKTRYLLVLLASLVAVVFITAAFSAGFLIGNNVPPLAQEIRSRLGWSGATPAVPGPRLEPGALAGPRLSSEAGTPEDLEELFVPFWEAWSIVHERYVDQPLDDEALMRGALEGMLQSLGDPLTSYMDPDEFMQSNLQLDGEYEGIGAWVDTDVEYLTIISPIPGSPAEEAGLQPGDEIIAVDREDMTGVDGTLVIRRVMGPAGTRVRLTVRRQGLDQPLEVEVERARIVIPSVEGEMLPEGVAYVRLMQFGDQTADDLRAVLEDLLAQDPDGLILDLRFNGGGFLSSAIRITSEFIPEGVILYEEYGDGSRDTHMALSGGVATDIPLVVLINQGSASASEILAGAVQDYERGLLVGTRSFGKGSVQVVEPLSDDQGAVRVTIARWLTPDERQISGAGLEPDVVVEATPEDRAEGRDPVLERAVQLLTR